MCLSASPQVNLTLLTDSVIAAFWQFTHINTNMFPPPKKTTLIPASTRLMCNNKPFIYGVIWCNTGTMQENSPEKKKPGGKGLLGVEVRETARKQF